MRKAAASHSAPDITRDMGISDCLRMYRDGLEHLGNDQAFTRKMREVLAAREMPVKETATPKEMLGAFYRSVVLKVIMENPVHAAEFIADVRNYKDLTPQHQAARQVFYGRQYEIDIADADSVIRLFAEATKDINIDIENSRQFQRQEAERKALNSKDTAFRL